MLSIRNLGKAYPCSGKPLKVLEGFNLEIEQGKIISIIGPSGCGKTTFLYILAGILPLDEGKIIWRKGKALSHPSALVLQNYGLFPWKTVWKNTMLAMDICGMGKEEKWERAERILKEMDLLSFKDYYPNQLSGGQKQRVALSRAFALEPSLLLMDEPFSALDAFTREELQISFLKMWKKHSITTILVTHSLEEAIFLSHRIALMTSCPGRIIEILDNPYFSCRMEKYDEGYTELASRIRRGLKME